MSEQIGTYESGYSKDLGAFGKVSKDLGAFDKVSEDLGAFESTLPGSVMPEAPLEFDIMQLPWHALWDTAPVDGGDGITHIPDVVNSYDLPLEGSFAFDAESIFETVDHLDANFLGSNAGALLASGFDNPASSDGMTLVFAHRRHTSANTGRFMEVDTTEGTGRMILAAESSVISVYDGGTWLQSDYAPDPSQEILVFARWDKNTDKISLWLWGHKFKEFDTTEGLAFTSARASLGRGTSIQARTAGEYTLAGVVKDAVSDADLRDLGKQILGIEEDYYHDFIVENGLDYASMELCLTMNEDYNARQLVDVSGNERHGDLSSHVNNRCQQWTPRQNSRWATTLQYWSGYIGAGDAIDASGGLTAGFDYVPLRRFATFGLFMNGAGVGNPNTIVLYRATVQGILVLRVYDDTGTLYQVSDTNLWELGVWRRYVVRYSPADNEAALWIDGVKKLTLDLTGATFGASWSGAFNLGGFNVAGGNAGQAAVGTSVAYSEALSVADCELLSQPLPDAISVMPPLIQSIVTTYNPMYFFPHVEEVGDPIAYNLGDRTSAHSSHQPGVYLGTPIQAKEPFLEGLNYAVGGSISGYIHEDTHADPAGLDVSTNSMSLMFALKGGTSQSGIASFGSQADDDFEIIIFNVSGHIRATVVDIEGNQLNLNVNDGTWSDGDIFCVTWNPSTKRLELWWEGQLLAGNSGTFGGNVRATSDWRFSGVKQTGIDDGFSGTLHHLGTWDRVLSPTEIGDIYNLVQSYQGD